MARAVKGAGEPGGQSESLFDEAEEAAARRGRAARGPDAAAHPGRGDRPAAPDRRGHAVPQADRQRRADVAAAVGAAGHRQDHAGLRRQPGDQAAIRGAVRGQRRGQGRARRGRRRPPGAGHERRADRAVHRRGAPVLQDPAGRAAARRWRTAGSRSSARPPRTRSSPSCHRCCPGRCCSPCSRCPTTTCARSSDRALADPRGLAGAVTLDDGAADHLVRLAGGDARRALTYLEAAALGAAGAARTSTSRHWSARWTGPPSATTGTATSTTT